MAEPIPATRTDRRRARTRVLLVESARRLMRQQGVEATSIQQITDTADVGLGTFYLHFDSKVEVLAAVVEEMQREHHAEVERLTEGEPDAAAVVSTAVRYTLHNVVRDPLWSWFLLRSGIPGRRLNEAFGDHARGHVLRGLREGRFVVTDLAATSSFLNGAVAGVIAERVEGELDPQSDAKAAELVLVALGVAREEARTIASRPLPFLGD